MKFLAFRFVSVGLLFCLVCVVSCSVTEPGKANRILVNNLLDDLEEGFYTYNEELIFKHLHSDFLHNGNRIEDQRYIWYQRLLNFDIMAIEEREFNLRNDWGVVSFLLIFRKDGDKVVSEEPSKELGDISYFLKENGRWYIFGNQRP